MALVHQWTGQKAAWLQEAFDMTQEEFAGRLGVSVRSVASWHATPNMIPQRETQRILDTAYEQAGEAVHRRFALLLRPAEPRMEAQALRVAIAVVLRGDDVLLVCRRGDDGIRWGFPAGVVKPGVTADTVAVQETHGETGVHCTVRQHLGERIHPVTGVIAEYHLCDFLAGDATNRDPLENVDVTWVPRAAVTRFIPHDQIYPPILSALEAAA
ncbi:NUDIX domain-containing protein [Streptomyces sp. NPDC001492]